MVGGVVPQVTEDLVAFLHGGRIGHLGALKHAGVNRRTCGGQCTEPVYDDGAHAEAAELAGYCQTGQAGSDDHGGGAFRGGIRRE
ncbi:hypothetical protein D3C72_2395180 [compost metagenome]